MPCHTTSSPTIVRATIAHTILDTPTFPTTLGDIDLFPHQRNAATTLLTTLHRHHGALLCDDTGLGKTFVALAIATRYTNPLVLAPAALREMWQHAIARTRVPLTIRSIESLSSTPAQSQNTPTQPTPFDLIIVDEAHHVRTPSTRRYATLATLCATTHTLLMTATPIHNRRTDLCALLALFLGSHAYTLSDEEISQYVIRRTKARTLPNRTIPTVMPTQWHTLPPLDTTHLQRLHALRTLPPPVPLHTAGTAPTLVLRSLLHQWMSSDAAFGKAVARRIARATALLAALDAGRHPTPHELRAWLCGSDAIQLAFPLLMASTSTPHAPTLVHAVRQHRDALTTLVSSRTEHASAQPPSPHDAARAQWIRNIRHAHPNERIVAFAQYADTITMLFRLLRTDGTVAALTARGGTIASGDLTRIQTIHRFAPHANDVTTPPAHETITLLLTTDLLSEGVNLHDASVVIHLDLPWTAARLEQRIGRVARLGAPHPRVAIYGIAPVPELDQLLRSIDIVRAKAHTARHVAGTPSPMLPTVQDQHATLSTLDYQEIITHTLAQWRIESGPPPPARDAPRETTTAPRIAAVRRSTQTPEPAFLSACRVRGIPTLLTTTPDGTVTTSPRWIVRAMTLAIAPETCVTPTDVERARIALTQWDNTQHAAHDAGMPSHETQHETQHASKHATQHTRVKRAAVRHAHMLLANTPWAHRFRAATIVTETHHALSRPLPIAVERAIAPPHTNGATSLQPGHIQPMPPPCPPDDPLPSTAIEIVALLLLVPAEEAH